MQGGVFIQKHLGPQELLFLLLLPSLVLRSLLGFIFIDQLLQSREHARISMNTFVGQRPSTRGYNLLSHLVQYVLRGLPSIVICCVPIPFDEVLHRSRCGLVVSNNFVHHVHWSTFCFLSSISIHLFNSFMFLFVLFLF